MAHKINQNCSGCTACARRCPVGCITGEAKMLHVIDEERCIDCGVCGRGCPSAAVTDASGRTVERLKRNLWPVPSIDWLFCSGCEFCINICPTQSLALIVSQASDGGVCSLENPKSCVGCGMCAGVCGKGAIIMEYPADKPQAGDTAC